MTKVGVCDPGCWGGKLGEGVDWALQLTADRDPALAYHNSGSFLQGMAPSHCKVSDLTLFKYPVYWLKANSDRESKVVSKGSCFRKGKL